MHANSQKPRRGFTLIETVIAIGVVAVLLSGFLIVFAPAAAGIKESIDAKSAARLVNTLEEELVSLRGATEATEYGTGFNKAFDFILGSSGGSPDDALLVYKYRAQIGGALRADGTPSPVASTDGLIPGQDFVVRNMMRRRGDTGFAADLPATEGAIYLVKAVQLVLDNTGELVPGTAGQIFNGDEPLTPVDESGTPAADADSYNQAVIPFVADFFALPSRDPAFFDNQFSEYYGNVSRPAFSRNLAVRR